MDDYRDEVERLARERTGAPFYNSSIDHAAVIVEKMFRHAAEEVCIISNHLNARVFGQEEVIFEADAFLSNANNRLRIILEDDVSMLSEGHPFARIMRSHPHGYEIRQMSPKMRELVKYHFTLADRDSYRFEPDKAKWEAVASFGDNEGAANLRSAFEAIWNDSTTVSLPASIQ
jgi:hypothetical protein